MTETSKPRTTIHALVTRALDAAERGLTHVEHFANRTVAYARTLVGKAREAAQQKAAELDRTSTSA